MDALFGSGLNKQVQGTTKSIIEWINQQTSTVISIDLPSGLFIDKTLKDNAIVKASYTLTFQTTKLVLLIQENALFIGDDRGRSGAGRREPPDACARRSAPTTSCSALAARSMAPTCAAPRARASRGDGSGRRARQAAARLHRRLPAGRHRSGNGGQPAMPPCMSAGEVARGDRGERGGRARRRRSPLSSGRASAPAATRSARRSPNRSARGSAAGSSATASSTSGARRARAARRGRGGHRLDLCTALQPGALLLPPPRARHDRPPGIDRLCHLTRSAPVTRRSAKRSART